MTITLQRITAAADAIAGVVVRTPTVRSAALSAALGAEIYLKLEILQRTGSFKDRGALVKLLSLSDEQKKSGVIAISAGNHAQGVAYHAQRLGIPATIVMPEATPFTKIVRTEAFDARVLLHGESVNAAEPFAQDLAEADSLTLVHPYDDELIVTGQGTIALEMLADVDDLDTIVRADRRRGCHRRRCNGGERAFAEDRDYRRGSRTVSLNVRSDSRTHTDIGRQYHRRRYSDQNSRQRRP